jgi:phosphate transport system permease protein
MTARTHPFRTKTGLGSYQEIATFWLLRAFTYLILAFGVLIFGIIIVRGAPAVFGSFRLDGQLPFIHNDFLFTKPQTLHVFKYRGQVMQMPADEFNRLTAAGPAAASPAAAPASADVSTPAPASPAVVPAATAPPLAPQAAAIANAATATTPASNTRTSLPASPADVKNGPTLAAAATNAANQFAAPSTNAAPVAPAPSPAPAASTAAINPDEITDHESYNYAAGGIWPQIVGTVLLVIGSMAIALVLGVFSAIYLSEYSRQGPLIDAIRLAIINLAGVPSIVFGLFGVALFVHFFGWNISMLAGWFTLAFMVLPVIITASEESLRAVPKGFREGSLALGASKWQTIRLNVLPYALPGILTSSVLGVARVAGETAPILFTAAYALSDKLPWEDTTGGEKFAPGFLGYLQFPFVWMRDFLLHPVNALPYHIYVVSTKIPQNEYTERVQYGTAFVFLAVVMAIALASVLLRLRLRSSLKW